MKIKYNSSPLFYFAGIFLITLSSVCYSQEKKDVIQRAMRDELERSMKELVYEKYERPFFISYTINEVRSFTAFASMGALTNSAEVPIRNKHVRLLVGNYEFNDESIDNSDHVTDTENEISLPIDDDYYGIRRSLWISTDAIYKSAAKQLQNNQNTVKEQKAKTQQEVPHRSFAKAEPAQINQAFSYSDVDQKKLENYVRELSALFTKYSEIKNSNVIISNVQGKRYIENSEGTSIKTGIRLAFLQISCQSKTEKGEMLFDNLSKYATSADQFPPLDQMKAELETFIKNFITLRKEPVVTEEYTGPVLFSGEAVSNIFNGLLLSYNKGLYASNAIEDQSKGIKYENNNSLESKVGKLVLPEGFSVKCTPSVKEFNGQPVYGSFEADDEGVMPPKELVVIEKGILKNLFHDRSSIKPDQVPNGFGDGPGILQVSFTGGTSFQSLKQKLIEKAKAEGLEYGLIIKEISMRGMGLTNVYKVAVADGKETLLRSGQVEEITIKELKKTLGASKDLFVHHIQSSSMSSPGLTTLITPSALLLEEVEVKPTNSYFQKDEEYVKSPFE
jgi:predicted Zn-dependent protease